MNRRGIFKALAGVGAALGLGTFLNPPARSTALVIHTSESYSMMNGRRYIRIYFNDGDAYQHWKKQPDGSIVEDGISIVSKAA